MRLYAKKRRSVKAATIDVVGVGENSLDFLAVGGGWPPAGGKGTLDEFLVAPGGQVATALVACARLGLRAHYVGVFGDDRWGAEIRRGLEAEEVEVTAVERAGVSSRTAVVLVDGTGQRTIVERRDPRLAMHETELPVAVIQSSRLLLIDATDVPAAMRAARAAEEAGTPVILDVERRVAEIDRLLASADVVVAPAAFVMDFGRCSNLAEGLAALETRFAPSLVVATLGAAGSLARCRGTEIRTPAPAVVVRDTTGAGDAFRGGLAAAWLRAGDEAEVGTLLEYANAVAALNCRALGAQTALPAPAEVDRLRCM